MVTIQHISQTPHALTVGVENAEGEGVGGLANETGVYEGRVKLRFWYATGSWPGSIDKYFTLQ